jgi:hypothetical protein
MLFTNLNLSKDEKNEIISTLFYLLKDKSVFVKTWSISSLTILAMENKDKKDAITTRIKELEKNKSAAVKNRVSKALDVLENDKPLPPVGANGKDKYNFDYLITNHLKTI